MNAHVPPDPLQSWLQGIADIEAGLVGGAILYPQALGSVLQTGVQPEHFSDAGCMALWQRISDIVSRGGAIDHRTVLQGGAGIVVGDGADGAEFHARVVASATTPASMAEYANIVKAAWVIRNYMDTADQARSQVAASDAIALARSLIEATDALRDCTLERAGSARGSLEAIAKLVSTEAQEMLQGKRERPPATGLTDLDRHLPLGGLAPGALIILAGRTGAGKTLVGSSLASRVASKGKGAIYFSLEVPSREIAARVVCSRIGSRGPNYGDILSGRITPSEAEEFHIAYRDLGGMPLHIDDSAALSIQDIHLEAKKWASILARKETDLGLVVIDHAQIVKPSTRYQGNRVGELGEIANAAKVMAKQLGCAVVLCSQLNRGVEGRESKRPMLSDLRASGEVEEAADAVLMLFREAYYVEKSAEYLRGDLDALDQMEKVRNVIEIGIDKSRQGSTGRATLWCDPGRSIVSDLVGGRI